MKIKIVTSLFFSIGFMGLLFISCTATKNTSSNQDSSGNAKDINSTTKVVATVEGNNSLTLANYLRRVPGVQVDQRGSDVSVMIRGASSIGNNNQPLFVVNSSPIGNSYQEAANAVDVNDIKSVNVIQGTEGQQTFGMRGANGVIQIITKSPKIKK